MSDDYTYDPNAWHPVLAGVVAGATAAIVGAVVSFFLRSPDEIVANSLAVVLVALAIGGVSGALWRRLRATSNAVRTYSWAIAGGFLAAMVAIVVVDQTTLSGLVPYAAPVAAIIFISVGFLTPLYAGVTAPAWIAAIPIVIALALGIGLFGRGNVASGELSLDDLETTTSAPTTTTQAIPSDTAASDATVTTTTEAQPLSGTLAIPDDLEASYVVANATATYSVEEELQGLATVGVGETNAVDGVIVPSGAFEFAIDLQSFESDQSRRDSRVREWFADHPVGTFVADAFPLPSTTEVGAIEAFDVMGTMTVNDISRDVTWAVEARVEADGTLSVTGETFIVLSEFDIPVLSVGFIEMEDGATIEVLFSAVPG